MEQNVKELPYGVQDFITIVEQNIYYVDKTMYIPELERRRATSSSSALAVLARACSSACSMPTTTAALRISSRSGLATSGLASIPRPCKGSSKCCISTSRR